MDREFRLQIQNDCTILLVRALMGKDLSMFGVDGNGEHGSDYMGHTHNVLDIKVIIDDDSDINMPEGWAIVSLEGYDASVYGHAMTDKNIEISLNANLALEEIDAECWSWANLEEQGQTYVCLRLDVNKLLSW